MITASKSILNVTSFKERAYTQIRDNIISCRLLPGTLLNEKDLADQLGISRTPVREALNRLEQENLVRIMPQRGVLVTEVTMKMMIETYQIREVLEPFIARLATPLIAEEQLLKFKRIFTGPNDNNLLTPTRSDNEFHVLLVESCGNSLLEQIMTSICAQTDRMRTITCSNPLRLQEADQEHLDIVEAMLQRDGEKAYQSMSIHMIRSRQVAF